MGQSASLLGRTRSHLSTYPKQSNCKKEIVYTKTWSRVGLVTCNSRDAQYNWIECPSLVEVEVT